MSYVVGYYMEETAHTHCDKTTHLGETPTLQMKEHCDVFCFFFISVSSYTCDVCYLIGNTEEGCQTDC